MRRDTAEINALPSRTSFPSRSRWLRALYSGLVYVDRSLALRVYFWVVMVIVEVYPGALCLRSDLTANSGSL